MAGVVRVETGTASDTVRVETGTVADTVRVQTGTGGTDGCRHGWCRTETASAGTVWC